MSRGQRDLIEGVGFGGLLKIASGRLPAAISKWLVKNFEPGTEEIVIPGRGRIKANAVAVHRLLGLPMGPDEVKYEFNGSAINTINELYKFEDGRAPRITTIAEWLETCKEANDDYLRRWLMIAISTFLTGSTSLCISPKCYPALVDLRKVKNLNWCHFVVDTLKQSVGKMDRQDSVLGCQFFLTVLYLDSLELKDIEVAEIQPRVAAWNMKLMNQVIKLDTNMNGTFRKHKFKKLDGLVTEATLFGDLHDIDNFICHRASAAMSSKKKRRFCQVVRKACISFTEVMGTFISELSAISDGSDDEDGPALRRSTRKRTKHSHQQAQNIVDDDDENDSNYIVDEDEEEAESVEEEEEVLEDEGAELEDDGVDVNVDPPDKVDTEADGFVCPEKSRQSIAKKDEVSTDATAEDKEGSARNSRQATAMKDEVSADATVEGKEGSARDHRNDHADKSSGCTLNVDKEAVQPEVVPSQMSRRERLRLPPTSAVGKSSWDFSPPPIDTMSFIDFGAEKNVVNDDNFWESFTEEDLQSLGEQANKVRAGLRKEDEVVVQVDEMRREKLPSVDNEVSKETTQKPVYSH